MNEPELIALIEKVRRSPAELVTRNEGESCPDGLSFTVNPRALVYLPDRKVCRETWIFYSSGQYSKDDMKYRIRRHPVTGEFSSYEESRRGDVEKEL